MNNYQRAGGMRYEVDKPGVNYEPNSFGGPAERADLNEPSYGFEGRGIMARWDHREGNDDYTQAGNLFRLLPEDERARLIDNLVDHMKSVPPEIQLRQTRHFYRADPRYGEGVAKGLGLKIEALAG